MAQTLLSIETLDKQTPSINIEHLKPTFLGKFVYSLFPLRRRIVLANMNVVFGDVLSSLEIRRLAQCFYSHIIRLGFENLSMSWWSEDKIRRRIRIIGH